MINQKELNELLENSNVRETYLKIKEQVEKETDGGQFESTVIDAQGNKYIGEDRVIFLAAQHESLMKKLKGATDLLGEFKKDNEILMVAAELLIRTNNFLQEKGLEGEFVKSLLDGPDGFVMALDLVKSLKLMKEQMGKRSTKPQTP